MSINVHIFDRNLDPFIIDYIQEHNPIDSLVLQSLYQKYFGNLNHPGVQGLELILNNIGSNYDDINQVDILKLLGIVFTKLDVYTDETAKTNIIDLILEQMSDMFLTGQCSQGRSIRLIQILKCII